jgi:pimeloyl-ACP methyl ester carboxylesterase
MRRLGQLIRRLLVGLLGLLVVGAIYQQIGLMLDGKWTPGPDEMIDLGDRMVHLVCVGSGSHTYLLDAGAGAGTFEWWRMQTKLASSARVCAFDRAGLAWSTPAKGGFDGSAAAEQLSALVKGAGIATPFVYVGHSLGANFAMIYQARFPESVSALVLIEPGDPKDMLEDFHGTREQAMRADDCDAMCYVAEVATLLGVVRLSAISAGSKSFDGDVRAAYRATLARPSNMMTAVASLNATVKTAYENQDIRDFGATPVLVFASSAPRKPEGKETLEDVRLWRVGQLAYFGSLATMSTHGSGPVIIRDSTHSTMVTGERQSTELVQAIVEFIADQDMK